MADNGNRKRAAGWIAAAGLVVALLRLTASCSSMSQQPAVHPPIPDPLLDPVPTSTAAPNPMLTQVTDPATPGAWTWGPGRYGELGNGDTADSSAPVEAVGLPALTAIAGIDVNSYALGADGTVWAWGQGSDGALGNGSTADSSVPVRVLDLDHVTAVGGGAGNGYAVRSDGTVWAWGAGFAGALGNGGTADSATPVQVRGLDHAIAVAGGSGNGYALRSDGTVWAWGGGDGGELGNGSTADSAVPVQVSGLRRITSIAVGDHLVNDAYALDADGTVWAWGSDAHGELGDHMAAATTPCRCGTTPVRVDLPRRAVAVTGGYIVGYAVLDGGAVMGWGSPSDGALGTNGGTADTGTPVVVAGLDHITAVAAGSASFALRADGSVWAWGAGDRGSLGDGDPADSATPRPVLGLHGVRAIADRRALVG